MPASNKSFTVATWNVNGIRAREAQFLEWVAADAPDVICLQEIKATPSQLPAAVANLQGYSSYWHGGAGGYSGVSLHIRDGVFDSEPVYSHPAFDMETRIVEARVGDLLLASVYIPNGGKDYPAKLAFMKQMQAYVKAIKKRGEELIICGDMNVALTDADIHPTHNKPGIIGTRPEERELLAGIIDQGLVDVARMLEPDNDRLFTWWPFWRTARQRNLGWRIDYIFASSRLARTATSSVVRRDTGTSDHAPVIATFG
jgi:exodeoxyribonuclease-3